MPEGNNSRTALLERPFPYHEELRLKYAPIILDACEAVVDDEASVETVASHLSTLAFGVRITASEMRQEGIVANPDNDEVIQGAFQAEFELNFVSDCLGELANMIKKTNNKELGCEIFWRQYGVDKPAIKSDEITWSSDIEHKDAGKTDEPPSEEVAVFSKQDVIEVLKTGEISAERPITKEGLATLGKKIIANVFDPEKTQKQVTRAKVAEVAAIYNLVKDGKKPSRALKQRKEFIQAAAALKKRRATPQDVLKEYGLGIVTQEDVELWNADQNVRNVKRVRLALASIMALALLNGDPFEIDGNTKTNEQAEMTIARPIQVPVINETAQPEQPVGVVTIPTPTTTVSPTTTVHIKVPPPSTVPAAPQTTAVTLTTVAAPVIVAPPSSTTMDVPEVTIPKPAIPSTFDQLHFGTVKKIKVQGILDDGEVQIAKQMTGEPYDLITIKEYNPTIENGFVFVKDCPPNGKLVRIGSVPGQIAAEAGISLQRLYELNGGSQNLRAHAGFCVRIALES